MKFGPALATSFHVDSESKITAVAPPGAAGKVDVSVTTNAGTTENSAADLFEYTVPPAPAPQPQPPVAPAQECKVPKLIGKKLKAAKRQLQGADCKLGHVVKKKGVTAKTGKIVKQRPKPGTAKPAGSKVSVKLG